MATAATAPNVNQAVINVGSGQETSIRDLVRKVLEITGGKPEVVFNTRTDAGVSRMCADLSLAAEKLNYHPQISLEAGLRRAFDSDPVVGLHHA